MTDLIEQFRRLDLDFNPPISPPDLRRLQKVLGATLRPDLLALYNDHDGTAYRSGPVPMRLLSAEEVIDFHAGGDHEYRWSDADLGVFWTDDNSNYAGLYLAGPHAGQVCFIDHDEVIGSDASILVPAYKSLRSFLSALLAAARDGREWYHMPRDFI